MSGVVNGRPGALLVAALLLLASVLASCGNGGDRAASTADGGEATPTFPLEASPPPTITAPPTVMASGLQIFDIEVGTGDVAKADLRGDDEPPMSG